MIKLIHELNTELSRTGMDDGFHFVLHTNGMYDVVYLEEFNNFGFKIMLYNDNEPLCGELEDLHENNEISYLEAVEKHVWINFMKMVECMKELEGKVIYDETA